MYSKQKQKKFPQNLIKSWDVTHLPLCGSHLQASSDGGSLDVSLLCYHGLLRAERARRRQKRRSIGMKRG
jgi:hypothetical protein